MEDIPQWMTLMLFLLGIVLMSLGICSINYVNSMSQSDKQSSAKQCNIGIIVIGVLFTVYFGLDVYKHYIGGGSITLTTTGNVIPEWMIFILFLLGIVLISLGSCSINFVNSAATSDKQSSAKQCNIGIIVIGVLFTVYFGYDIYRHYKHLIPAQPQSQQPYMPMGTAQPQSQQPYIPIRTAKECSAANEDDCLNYAIPGCAFDRKKSKSCVPWNVYLENLK